MCVCGGGISPEQASDIRSRRLPGGGDAGTASGRMTSQVTGKRDGKGDEQRSVHTQPEDRKGLVQAHCLDPGPWLRGSPVCRRTAVTSPCLLPSQPCPHHQFSHKMSGSHSSPCSPQRALETPPHPCTGAWPHCRLPGRPWLSAGQDPWGGKEPGSRGRKDHFSNANPRHSPQRAHVFYGHFTDVETEAQLKGALTLDRPSTALCASPELTQGTVAVTVIPFYRDPLEG